MPTSKFIICLNYVSSTYKLSNVSTRPNQSSFLVGLFTIIYLRAPEDFPTQPVPQFVLQTPVFTARLPIHPVRLCRTRSGVTIGFHKVAGNPIWAPFENCKTNFFRGICKVVLSVLVYVIFGFLFNCRSIPEFEQWASLRLQAI